MLLQQVRYLSFAFFLLVCAKNFLQRTFILYLLSFAKTNYILLQINTMREALNHVKSENTRLTAAKMKVLLLLNTLILFANINVI